jgi:tRNA pseudouridine55 synthase
VISGVVLVAKPAGPTSHDVVDIVRRALGERRVGHLGTLDPFAQGLLVLVVGRATRLAPYAGGWEKRYTGVMRLGATTDTDDGTGTVTQTSDGWRALEAGAVSAAFARFAGRYEQTPPAYSAVKVDGERAYRRARRGEAPAAKARAVDVTELVLDQWTPPDARFHATVSAGTYLRSLARDVGAALGCGGHLVALERTTVGPFALADAVAPEAVSPAAVRDAATLVSDLARRDLDRGERDAVAHGRAVAAGTGEEGRVALFTEGALLAVAEREGDVLKPRVVLVDA